MKTSVKAARGARTRTALEETARGLFETHGFMDVSSEEVVAAAGVTRGALYHHYGGKPGLFEAVLEACMSELHDELVEVGAEAGDAATAIRQGVARFLQLATEPARQRVLFVDGPAVMGWQAWRDMDDRYGLGLLKQAFSAASSSDSSRTDVAAHLLMSAMIEAAMLIARAPDPAAARAQSLSVLNSLIDVLV